MWGLGGGPQKITDFPPRMIAPNATTTNKNLKKRNRSISRNEKHYFALLSSNWGKTTKKRKYVRGLFRRFVTRLIFFVRESAAKCKSLH